MFLVVEYFYEMCIIIIYFHYVGPIYIIISRLRLGGLRRVLWGVWQWWWLGEEKEGRERESKYKCNLFFLVVYDGYCGGFVGWWWRRMVVCVAMVATCRGT